MRYTSKQNAVLGVQLASWLVSSIWTRVANRQKACTRHLPSHRRLLRRHEWLGVGTKGPPCIPSARSSFKNSPHCSWLRGPCHAGQDLMEERHPAQHRACRVHYQSHLSVRSPLGCVCLCRYFVCAYVGGSGTLPEWTVKWVRHLTACYASHQQHHSDAKRSGRDPFARQPRAQQRS